MPDTRSKSASIKKYGDAVEAPRRATWGDGSAPAPAPAPQAPPPPPPKSPEN